MAAEFFFLELIESLKTTLRRGWYLHGVHRPESVGDHMYRMAIMCLMINGLDEYTRTRAVYMALVHDMGEAIVGDIAPSDGISREQKHVREEMAFKFLACTLESSHPAFASEVLDLWREYEEGKSKVAVLVKQIDKLECIHQAVVYERRNDVDLSEFMGLKGVVTLPELKPLLDVCLQKYEEVKEKKESHIVVIFVSGGPGVGKGTTCTRLAEEFNLHHISLDDLLREEAQRSTSPYRTFIPESMQKSVLLPAQLTTQLLREEISEAQVRGKSRFLINGFPRSVAQAIDFELKITNKYSTLVLECSEAELRKRLQLRSTSSERIDDDTTDSIVRRFQTFNENNAEVVRYLEKQGVLCKIQAHGSVDEVYASVRSTVQEIINAST